MKKYTFLLITPILILANPLAAFAEDSPVKLDMSGHMKMYGNLVDQDGSVMSTDMLRDIDVTFSGETELSNGLTVGVLVNADGDGGDSFDVENSFIYASGNWGRISLGVDDGAAFLLQVAAPSADENIDGIKTFVNPINFEATGLNGTDFQTIVSDSGLDYNNDKTATSDKITYLTPVLSGMQAGVSYTPDVGNFSPASRSLNGNSPNDQLDEFGSAWEAGIRYENKISETINYRVGAGYTTVEVERTNNASTVDTFKEWNMGADFDIGNCGLGLIYTENNGGAVANNDSKMFVVGTDYTVGSVKYGLSYLHNTHEESATEEVKAQRLTAGFIYEYAPGLSFRGALSRTEADAPTSIGGDVQGTALTLGTQILF